MKTQIVGELTQENEIDWSKYIKFRLIQHRLFRKLFKGLFLYVENDLMMFPFWTDKIIKSCNTKIIKTECYGKYNWCFIGGIGNTFFEQELKADTKEKAKSYFNIIYNKSFVYMKKGNTIFNNSPNNNKV